MFRPERIVRSPTERWERLVSIYTIVHGRRALALAKMRKMRKARAEFVPKDEFQRRVELALFKGLEWKPIGCTCAQLREHFAIYFTDKIGWHNDQEWHVDYFIPRCTFKPADKMRAFHYTNLRPKRGRLGPIYTAPPLRDDPTISDRGVPQALPARIQAQAKRRATGEAESVAAKIRAKTATRTRYDKESAAAGQR